MPNGLGETAGFRMFGVELIDADRIVRTQVKANSWTVVLSDIFLG